MKILKLLTAGLILSVLFSSCLKEKVFLEEYEADLGDHFLRYETLNIDYDELLEQLESNGARATSLSLDIPSRPDWEFTMSKEDVSEMFPEDSKVILIGEGETLTEMPLPKFNAFEGRLLTSSKPTFFTFSVGEFEAEINDENGETYSIQSLKSLDENAPANLYVLYNQKDMVIDGAPCEAHSHDTPLDLGSLEDQAGLRANCYAIEVTQLCDYEFYRYQFGSNYSATSAYMSTRLYWASKRYWSYNRFPLNLVQRSIYVYTNSNDGLNSNNFNTMLTEWEGFYNKSWFNKKDVNALWSGKAVVSGYYGLAGVRALCTRPRQSFHWLKRYGGNASTSRLFAHEIGHNIGAPHDNSSNNFMNGNPANFSNSLGQNARNNIYGHIWNGGGNSCLSVKTCN